ncbi:SCA7-domain-containing protein [Violaceomyces palustris]|uniref:SCA7-domain-containing protein n=1 Tax=Violaceomyces palustris TaxID=1673888 RepID=A0ACD0NSR0_9BASI|nr:SCA7-domain-containing protein [Violaceomyces palustris]
MDSQIRPGPSWSDIQEATKSDLSSPPASTTGSPLWHYDDAVVTDFGPYALDDDVDLVECPDCSKPVLREALFFHQRNCQLARDIAEGRVSPSILEGDSKKRRMLEATGQDDDSAIEADVAERPTKRSKKAEAELRRKARLEMKEAKRKEKKKGGRKNKGPLDVDKQCGVINDKGLPCSRSLTCKSHSMGAKRAVEGRSRPYDELLFEWQKATNPSFVAKLEEKEKAMAAAKAAAAAAPPKEKKKKTSSNTNGPGGANKKSSSANKDGKDGKDGHGGGAGGPGGHANVRVEDEDADMYTNGADDAEVDAELVSIIEAITTAASKDRTTTLPLATRNFAGSFTARAKRMRRLRDILKEGLVGANSIASSTGAGFNGLTTGQVRPWGSVNGVRKGLSSSAG